jgi:hypothetical protein
MSTATQLTPPPPGKEMPAHFLRAPSVEPHDQRTIKVALNALRRMEQPPRGIVRSFRHKPQYNIDRLFLEYAERLRRVGREIELLLSSEDAIDKIKRSDPVQSP